MKKLVLASAIAASLFSVTSATADLSIYDIGRNQPVGSVHRSAPPAAREACNDRWDGLAVLACSPRSSAERPAWRGLN